MAELSIRTDRQSPNFNERTRPIHYLMLHYTGMVDGPSAIDWLCNPASKVSAHYVVEEDGSILRLVSDEARAWHAGVGSWRGETEMNGVSVGIEIVNGGHDFGLPDFAAGQVDIVGDLVAHLIARHGLGPEAVIGHSDYAPARKQDPGEKFPWASLGARGLTLWPAAGANAHAGDTRVLFDTLGTVDRGVAVVQTGLATIGYGVEVTGSFDVITQAAVQAFQRRFRPSKCDGIVDVETLGQINAVVEILRKA